jgi:ATP-binding cassette subfamily F protein uup
MCLLCSLVVPFYPQIVTPVINAQGLTKTYGIVPLFHNISFTVSEGDRIGVIGPNGSGKSTLMQILCGIVQPDSGEVAVRKRAKLGYVTQNSKFEPGETAASIVQRALERAAIRMEERDARMAETLGRAGFTNFEVEAAALSGGWQKRLAIVEGLVQAPDILFLDEPTNHLDLQGIKWLEGILQNAVFACVVVSHDRYLLENFGHEIVELNRIYEEGLLRVEGNYSSFLQAKEDYLQAQGRRQESLANRVHNELEWLRRGAKARRTKAKAQIKKANELIEGLAELNARTRTSTVDIEFSSTDRRTKQLIEIEGVAYAVGDRTLFSESTFKLKAGMAVGLVGPNGSGKTTMLRLFRGEIQPTNGTIRRAEHLNIRYFDQARDLDPGITLRRALAPDGDSVIYQGRSLHVASWASRFLFSSEYLDQPVGRLSGGERARVLVAQLMLQPADVLLLDEPTNDLDIPTLEVLEESLCEYAGTVVLVTHDRYMMDRVCTTILGLDGLGKVEVFADYSQWEDWQRNQQTTRDTTLTASRSPSTTATSSSAKKKLSYLEAREHAAIESRIAEAEEELKSRRAALEDPAIASDAPQLQAAITAVEDAQNTVDQLYERWAELEEKKG